MNKRKNVLSTIGLILGTAMILSACAALVYVDTQQRASKKKNSEIAETFFETVPEVYDGLMYDRTDTQMPAIQIEGNDLIGVLEVPILAVKLPVYASWDRVKVNQIPSRLSGSVYDSTLLMGGVDAEGQLDFFEDICVGDTVLFTDATGAKFEYILESIDVKKDLDTKKIGLSDDLTIFSKDMYFKKYTVLHLKLK